MSNGGAAGAVASGGGAGTGTDLGSPVGAWTTVITEGRDVGEPQYACFYPDGRVGGGDHEYNDPEATWNADGTVSGNGSGRWRRDGDHLIVTVDDCSEEPCSFRYRPNHFLDCSIRDEAGEVTYAMPPTNERFSDAGSPEGIWQPAYGSETRICLTADGALTYFTSDSSWSGAWSSDGTWSMSSDATTYAGVWELDGETVFLVYLEGTNLEPDDRGRASPFTKTTDTACPEPLSSN
jgi:hypothetical protein